MKIIFVCTGNTCRSPMAQGYLESLGLPFLHCESRGLFADGSAVSDNSAEAMKEIGIDISAHTSKQFTADDLDADMIICMSPSHRDILLSAGVKPERVSVLGNGIGDPFGGDIHIYRLCRDEIIAAVDSLVFGGAFTDYTVGDAEYSHLTGIAELEKECFSEPWSINALEESFAAGTRFFTAVTQDNRVIGYIGISAILDEGYITNIAVTDQYRKRGVGTMLLQKVFSFARKKGLSFVTLEVRVSNSRAISLYEKQGFVREGERRDFYTNPKENAIIMTRRFNLSL